MPNATLIRKSFPIVETKVMDKANGLVECIFSCTGNTDRQSDTIDAGAFAKALALKSSVPVVYAHVWNDINQVLGKTVKWEELLPGAPGLPAKLRAQGFGGVKATIQFDQDTPAGRLALTHVDHRNITDWSFAFDVDDDGAKSDDQGIRHIKSIREVFEVTLALIGANQDAMTLALKSMPVERPDPLREVLEAFACAATEGDDMLDLAVDAIKSLTAPAAPVPEPIETPPVERFDLILAAAEKAALSSVRPETDQEVVTPHVQPELLEGFSYRKRSWRFNENPEQE